jgi:hypothetical protein
VTPARDRSLTPSWRRATLAGAALGSAVLGTAFHAAAGGLLPGPVALALIVALLWGLTSVALGSRPGPWRLAGGVAAGQFLVHLALTATAGHGHATHGHAGHAHDPATPLAAGTSTAGTAAPGTLSDALGVTGIPAEALGTDPVALALQRIAEELTLGHASMALAHLLAGAAVGLWLAIGLNAGLLVAALRSLRAHPALTTALPLPPLDLEGAAVARGRSGFDRPLLLRPQHHCRVVGRCGPPRGPRLLVLLPASMA